MMIPLRDDFREFIRLLNRKRVRYVENRIDGVTFEECWKSRRAAVVDRLRIHFIDLPELLENKRASARPKDLEDLRNLPAKGRRRG